MGALETLQAKYGCQMLFVESGGDNLAANYSRELADYIIYVIDVSVSFAPFLYIYIYILLLIDGGSKGGDKIPRKGGPGISQSDLLVINKVSSASLDLLIMIMINHLDRPGCTCQCLSRSHGP